MILYHGSKGGIKGAIQPASRETCDFGRGFYLGDKEEQPQSLIAEYENSRFYTFDCDFAGLSVKEFQNDYSDQMDWASYIAYNRKILNPEKCPALCRKYEEYNHSFDVIIGVIANDKMTQALNRFFIGDLCDQALLDALKKVKLGNQYVLKTSEACGENHVRLIDSRPLEEKEIKQLKSWNMQRMRQMDGILDQIKTRYRRAQDVKYFDEIIGELG